jgi:transposase
MLKVEHRFMIKTLYQRGLCISEIAEITGHNRRTIRKIVNGPVSPPPQKRKLRQSKLDPFVPHLKKRIDDGVLNCSKLLDEIQKQGYQGGKSLVKDFVQPYREARQAQATVRYETEPGEQAQVDWGHFGFIEHNGRQCRLYVFVMTLGWSRAMYIEFTTSADATWWLRCHIHAFEYFGGVPKEVLHDNLKTAVVSRDADGTVHFNERYLDFAGYYGFTPKACRPYRAQTKGKVESGVRYVRSNFWPGLRFVDLADLNRQARDWLDGTANVRVHGTTGEVPFARLPQEPLQSTFGKPVYDTCLVSLRRATKDCYVSYAGNYYSVPAEYARKTLKLKETEDARLLVLNAQDALITEHRLLTGHHQRIAVPAHYANIGQGMRSAKQPTAIQITSAVSLAGQPAAPDVETRPLSWYEQLAEVAA